MSEEQVSPIANLLYKVVDGMLEGFQIISDDYKYIYVNETVARQGKRKREDLLGKTMMECYPGIENTPMFSELKRAKSQNITISMENEFEFPDHSKGWFQLIIHPIDAGVLIFSVDVTPKKIMVERFVKGIHELNKIATSSLEDTYKVVEMKKELNELRALSIDSN